MIITDGPAVGKELIVQAINTNYGPKNSFGIVIPGSGWFGTSNECATQFPGPYYWGNYNGGYANRTECANLPAVLQPGCQWRFDWFMGSDNPPVSFKEVTCPSELTAKSFCERI